MSSFHEMIQDDLVNEFFDPKVYGELHHVNGKAIYCMLDEDERITSTDGAPYGVYLNNTVLYARECDLPRGREGDRLDIDDVIYTVVVWRVDKGAHRVTLTVPMAY